MPGVAILLVVVSAIVHAGWNAIVKRQADPEAAAALVVVGAAACSAALGALAGEGIPGSAWPWVLASGVVEGVYFVTLGRALARLPLGTAYGVSRGGGQLVTWPVSVGWLGEPVSAVAVAGAGILVAGLAARVRRPWHGDGLAWAAGCALAIGAYPLTYQQALRAGAPPYLLFTLSLLLALPVQLLGLGPSAASRLRAAAAGRGGALAVAAVACAASFLLFLAALSLGGAGRASAVRNTSIAFATVFGAWSGEALDRRAWLAAGAITAGAVLVSLG